MMKTKRNTLKVMALTLVFTLAFSVVAFAVPAPTAPGGVATIRNPVFSVTLPTTINFTIDPFDILDNGQIHSPEFAVINRSNVPVVVQADFLLQHAPRVEVVEESDGMCDGLGDDADGFEAVVQLHFAAGTDSDFRLNTTAAVGPTATYLDWDFDTLAAGNSINFYDEGAVEGILAAFAIAAWNLPANADTVAQATSVYFVLDSAIDYFNDALTALQLNQVIADPDDNVAAFTVVGEVSTYSPWAVADLRLFSRFTISPRTPSDFADLDGEGLATAHNVYTGFAS